MIDRRELDETLGMFEMEETLWFLLEESEKTGIPFHKLTIHLGRIKDAEFRVLLGFVQLVYRGCIVPRYPNSIFQVGQKLIEWMRERKEIWKDLPDAQTTEEFADELTKRVFPSSILGAINE